MDILRDPVWQFIAVIIALIAIIVTLTQRYRKEIVYDIISDTPILSIKEEVKNRVKVLFDDKPMTNARLIILRIWNSGNVPIIPSDYIEPITLNFGADAEILDADILASIPDDIKSKLTLKKEKGQVIIENTLLNSQDAINLKILVAQTDLNHKVEITTRLIGVKKINDINDISNYMYKVYLITYIPLAIILILLVACLTIITKSLIYELYGATFSIISLFILSILFNTITYRRSFIKSLKRSLKLDKKVYSELDQ